MKRFLIALSATLLLAVGMSASAKTFRAGVLDMHKVMTDAPQVQTIKTNLQKRFKPQETKLAAARDVLKADAEKLRKESTILSNSDREALQKKVIEEQRNLQKDQIAFQQEAVKAQNESFKALFDKVKTISQKIAKKEKLNVVITSEAALYFDNSLDITSRVLTELKRTS